MTAVPLCVHTTVPTLALGALEVSVVGSMRRDDEDAVFVSHIPVLQVYSQGRTPEEARRAIENAVRLYVKTAVDRGLLARILERPGFRLSDTAGVPRQFIRALEPRAVSSLSTPVPS
jgi:predicted RNase H-like HicB family nuclease